MVSTVWSNSPGLNVAYDKRTEKMKWQAYYCAEFSLIVLSIENVRNTYDLIEALFHEYLHHWTFYLPLHCTHVLGKLIDDVDRLIHYKRIFSH